MKKLEIGIYFTIFSLIAAYYFYANTQNENASVTSTKSDKEKAATSTTPKKTYSMNFYVEYFSEENKKNYEEAFSIYQKVNEGRGVKSQYSIVKWNSPDSVKKMLAADFIVAPPSKVIDQIVQGKKFIPLFLVDNCHIKTQVYTKAKSTISLEDLKGKKILVLSYGYLSVSIAQLLSQWKTDESQLLETKDFTLAVDAMIKGDADILVADVGALDNGAPLTHGLLGEPGLKELEEKTQVKSKIPCRGIFANIDLAGEVVADFIKSQEAWESPYVKSFKRTNQIEFEELLKTYSFENVYTIQKRLQPYKAK